MGLVVQELHLRMVYGHIASQALPAVAAFMTCGSKDFDADGNAVWYTCDSSDTTSFQSITVFSNTRTYAIKHDDLVSSGFSMPITTWISILQIISKTKVLCEVSCPSGRSFGVISTLRKTDPTEANLTSFFKQEHRPFSGY